MRSSRPRLRLGLGSAHVAAQPVELEIQLDTIPDSGLRWGSHQHRQVVEDAEVVDMAVYGPDGNRSLHIINGNFVWRSKNTERKR